MWHDKKREREVKREREINIGWDEEEGENIESMSNLFITDNCIKSTSNFWHWERPFLSDN